MKKIDKKRLLDDLFRTIIVVVANVLLSFATVWFLEPARLYSGGATGLSQLFVRIIERFGGRFNLGLMTFIINIPIAVVGWRFVSKRFAIFSIMAIGVQSLVTGLIDTSPFAVLAHDIVTDSGSVMNYGGILTLAIFGGLLAGFASGLALKFGTSTGGVDILAQALALHKGISIGMFTMIFNIIITLVGGLFLQGSLIVVLYTFVRLILNSLVMDKIHTAYTYTSLNIFTSHGEEIAERLMIELNRGCTIFEGVGAYTHQKHTELYCVLSTYEVEKAMIIIKKIDPATFVVVSPVRKVTGNFIKKTIV